MKSRTHKAAGTSLLLLSALTVGALNSAQAAPSHEHRHASEHVVRACPKVAAPGHATCLAEIVVPSAGKQQLNAGPPAGALTPDDVQSAYNLRGKKSQGRTVAIVDAFGYPNLERDLNIYRRQFGMKPCTTGNGCLHIIDQKGGTQLPAFDAGWAGEQALDVDAVSATCPDCKITVVQAKSTSMVDLGTGVMTAAKQPGVAAISNSYGGAGAPDSRYGHYFRHPGIALTASTGDGGYQGEFYPASSSYVTAVGGTSLAPSNETSRGWDEQAWSGAGSGCSNTNAPLPDAAYFDTGCDHRAMADVSAAADPYQGGLAVYYPTSATESTWSAFGGTSESAPIIAGVYALSGKTKGMANRYPYRATRGLNDVTWGQNGFCYPAQWCQARKGWDGPTGLGTPNGTAAF